MKAFQTAKVQFKSIITLYLFSKQFQGTLSPLTPLKIRPHRHRKETFPFENSAAEMISIFSRIL
jgi:hypothetical protein